jgi:hypothetical protein
LRAIGLSIFNKPIVNLQYLLEKDLLSYKKYNIILAEEVMNKKFKEDLKKGYKFTYHAAIALPIIFLPIFVALGIYSLIEYHHNLQFIGIGIILILVGIMWVPFSIFIRKRMQIFINKIDEEDRDDRKE